MRMAGRLPTETKQVPSNIILDPLFRAHKCINNVYFLNAIICVATDIFAAAVVAVAVAVIVVFLSILKIDKARANNRFFYPLDVFEYVSSSVDFLEFCCLRRRRRRKTVS